MTEDQELELFTIKTKFFREIPHPKLILKAINQVEKLMDHTPMFEHGTFDFGKKELINVLKSHTEKTIAFKNRDRTRRRTRSALPGTQRIV
jgi:hypothetical protein